MSPTFLAQGTEPVEYMDTLVGLQIIRPEQYARLLQDLTGFEWVVGVQAGQTGYGDVSMLNDDTVGFRSMTGGVDGKCRHTDSFKHSQSIVDDESSLFGCRKFCG